MWLLYLLKLRQIEEIYNDLFDNYIITGIIEYCDTESNDKNNIERKIEQNQDNFRRIRLLDEYNTEEQIAEETKKRIESKSVEGSLNKWFIKQEM